MLAGFSLCFIPNAATEFTKKLVLINIVTAKTTTCRGFEFRVTNADAEYRRMLKMGIKIEHEPQNLPWGYRYFNIKDPDGNGIDIVQVL